jgi:hypothetical protein
MCVASYTTTATADTATNAALYTITDYQVMHGIGLKSSSNVAGGGERVIIGSCPYAIAQVIIACANHTASCVHILADMQHIIQ